MAIARLYTELNENYTKGRITFSKVQLPVNFTSTDDYIGIDNMMNDLHQVNSYLTHENKFTKLVNAISIDWNGAKVPNVCTLFSGNHIIDKIAETGIEDTSEFLYIIDLLVDRALSLRQPKIKNYSSQEIRIKINDNEYTIAANSELQFNPTENSYYLTILNDFTDGKWELRYGTTVREIDNVGENGVQLQIGSSIKEVSIYGIADQPSNTYKITNNTGINISAVFNGTSITINDGATYEAPDIVDSHVTFTITTTFTYHYVIQINGNDYNNVGLDPGNHTITKKQILFDYTITPGNRACDNLIVKSANYTGSTTTNVEHKYYKVTSFNTAQTFVLDYNSAIISCSLPSEAQTGSSWTLGGTIISDGSSHQFNSGSYALSYNEGSTTYTYRISNSRESNIAVSFKLNNEATAQTIDSNGTFVYTAQQSQISFVLDNPNSYTTYTLDNTTLGNNAVTLQITSGTEKTFTIKATKEADQTVSIDPTGTQLLMLGTSSTNNAKVTLTASGNNTPTYTWQITGTGASKSDNENETTIAGTSKGTSNVQVTATSPKGQTANASVQIDICKLDITGGSTSVQVGNTTTYTISLDKPTNTSYSISSVTWTSSNTTYATVTGSGTSATITGVAATPQNTTVNITATVTVETAVGNKTYTVTKNVKVTEATQVDTYNFYLGKLITSDNQIGIATPPHELTNDEINDIISHITFETIETEQDIYAPSSGFDPIIVNGQSYIMRKVPKTQPTRLYMILPKFMLDNFISTTYKNGGFIDLETSNIDFIVDTKNVSTTFLMSSNFDLYPVSISRKDITIDNNEYSIVGWGKTTSEDLVVRNPSLDYNAIFGNNS